jgi:hypothetical protein
MDGGSAENAGAVFRIRYHGILAPNAKWRAQVVPKPKEHVNSDMREQESEAKRNYIPWPLTHIHVLRGTWTSCPAGATAQARVRTRPGPLPNLQRPTQAHRRDRTSGGDRENPHASEPHRPPAAATPGASIRFISAMPPHGVISLSENCSSKSMIPLHEKSAPQRPHFVRPKAWLNQSVVLLASIRKSALMENLG